MCGITGFIDFSGNSSKQDLEKMMNSLSHRGPDGSGSEWFDHNNYQIGLSHRRLSIIDLSDLAKQPMCFNETWITYNGEVYNFKELKCELIELGHSFLTHSDTEVILHAYHQWGKNCVDRFIGMFAFVIYDSRKNEINIFRDRAGVKPLYYYWNNGLFLFASELKAFHQHPNFIKEIDPSAVNAFVQFGNVPTALCIFKNCYKLSPGHYLSFDLNKQHYSNNKYWEVADHYQKPKMAISFEEAKKETERLMISASNFRMVSDVPVGVFLSGGYDSASITALLQASNSSKLNTFTIGVNEWDKNEAVYAKSIADHIGTSHHEIYCSQKQALDLINDLPYYFDEPFADSSAIPTMLVSKMAREKVKVAISADGGDELFAGYNRYDLLMREHEKINKLPEGIRRTAHLLFNPLPTHYISSSKLRNTIQKTLSVLKDNSVQNFMHQLNVLFTKEDLQRLLKDNKGENLAVYPIIKDADKFMSPLSYMMMMDYKMYLTDDILQKVDRSSMSQSLESREPFLDHRLIEWVAQLPDEFKYNQGIKKHILKEITHQYIPKHLMDRPKMGFSIPIEKWLQGDLKPVVQHYLDRRSIQEQGVFDADYVKNLIDRFYKGDLNLGRKVWYILMFQMWYEKWGK